MKRLLHIIIVLITIAISANAQKLTAEPLEVQKDGQTEVVVKYSGENKRATALQFYLRLPEGLSYAQSDDNYGVTLGKATDGHTLSVEALNSGDLQFVLYSMDFKPLGDGELLRIPVKAGSETMTAKGRFYDVYVSSEWATSLYCLAPSFDVTIKGNSIRGDVNEDGVVNGTDIQAIINLIVESQYDEKADVNEDGNVNGTDIQEVINIIVNAE